MNFNISKYSNSIKIFNYENNIIDKTELNIYSNIVILIKLQNIWIDLDNKSFGLNWNIYQIKNWKFSVFFNAIPVPLATALSGSSAT